VSAPEAMSSLTATEPLRATTDASAASATSPHGDDSAAR